MISHFQLITKRILLRLVYGCGLVCVSSNDYIEGFDFLSTPTWFQISLTAFGSLLSHYLYTNLHVPLIQLGRVPFRTCGRIAIIATALRRRFCGRSWWAAHRSASGPALTLRPTILRSTIVGQRQPNHGARVERPHRREIGQRVRVPQDTLTKRPRGAGIEKLRLRSSDRRARHEPDQPALRGVDHRVRQESVRLARQESVRAARTPVADRARPIRCARGKQCCM